MARDIRSKALERIAALSASKSTGLFEKSDLDRLCRACTSHAKGKGAVNGAASVKSQSLGRVPMVSESTDMSSDLGDNRQAGMLIHHALDRLFENTRFCWPCAKLPPWFKMARTPNDSADN